MWQFNQYEISDTLINVFYNFLSLESLAVDSSLKYLEEFKKMIMLLQSLHLLECLCDFPIITVIERKVHIIIYVCVYAFSNVQLL